eukprot:6491273-Amphidinium_carterae.1
MQSTASTSPEFWAIIIDTGVAVSVCLTTFAEHIPIKPVAEESRKQYVTVTGEGLTIQGWKGTTLIIGAITMQVCFVVANAQSPLIGLPDLNDDKTIIHTGDKPYIEQFGYNEQLHLLGQYLDIAAITLPGFHTPNEIQFDSTVQKRYNPATSTSLIGDIELLSQQANVPKQLRQPPQQTKQEQNEHRVTHLPYRSWCPICAKATGQPTHRRKFKEHSNNCQS